MSRSIALASLFFVAGCSTVLGLDNEYVRNDDVGDDGSAASPSGVGSGGGADGSSSGSVGGSVIGAGGAGGAAAAGGGGGAGAGGAGPVSCGNGVIDPGEECDDMNSPTDAFCNGCQISCTMGKEHPATHHCYAHSGASLLSWTDAKAACEAAGTHLASITTQAEHDWLLQNLAPPSDSWLGGNDLTSEGTFAWTTGEQWTWPMSGAPWDADEPNGSGDCLAIKSAGNDLGEFTDSDCIFTQAFYCEREPAGIPAP